MNVEEQFDTIAPDYIKSEEDTVLNSYEYDINWPSIQKMLPSSPSSIMDYGAGGGSFSQIMIDSGYYVLATDNSPNMIAELKSKNIPCRLWAYDEPPIDQIFDAIVAKLVIQFIDDLPAFATSMKRQLPSRGKLIVSVPHPDKSRELLQKGSDTYLTEIGSTGLMVHMIHRELNEIRQNFEEQNYRIVAIDSPVDKAGSQPKRLNLCFETLA